MLKPPEPAPMQAFSGGGMPVGGIGAMQVPGQPRYLQGPGDGMSDDIPAVIDGREPAALATSEFVLPADIVSHIGNGSSEAGAQRLHDLMERIRMARTGNPEQAPQIDIMKLISEV